MRDSSEQRLKGALLVAFGAHCIALCWIALRPSEPRIEKVRNTIQLQIELLEETRAADDVTLEVQGETSTKVDSYALIPSAETISNEEAKTRPRARSRAGRSSEVAVEMEGKWGAVTAAPGAATSLNGGPSPEATTPKTPDPSRPKVDLGLNGGLARIMMGRSPRIIGAEEPERDAGGLQRGLSQRDVANGMGRAGFVVSLGRTVTLEVGPAIESNAIFSVGFDIEGKVASVAMVEASSEHRQWGSVGNALERALHTRTMPLPPKAAGYLVLMKVQTRVRLPDGSRAGGRNRTEHDGGSFKLKIPDPVNIGQSSRRTVSAWVLSETTL